MGKGFISTHDVLLYLLDQLPEEESAELRVELKAIYAELVAQLEVLEATSLAYDGVAAKIRAKSSLRKRRAQQPDPGEPVMLWVDKGEN
jgi:hypothetical protein